MSRFPVSVKGVVSVGRKIPLLKNEREEWELPGGKLEMGESPEECVRREVMEELALDVEVGPLLDAWVYEVVPGGQVLVLTYGCFAENLDGALRSEEHSDMRLFDLKELNRIRLPEGYRRSVEAWSRHPALLRRSKR